MPSRTRSASETATAPALAAGDHDPAGAEVAESPGLADRVGLAQDQGGLVGVGQEDVGLRAGPVADGRDSRRGPGVATSSTVTVPARRARGEPLGQRLGLEAGQDQVTCR